MEKKTEKRHRCYKRYASVAALETYHFFIHGTWMHQLSSVFLQVRQQTTIAHEGHDDVWSWTSINAHSNQTNNVRVIEALHFDTLRHDVINLLTTKVS